MKATNLICVLGIMALAIIFFGCKRALPPGAVLFSGSGIALVPGEDWQPLKSFNPDDVGQITCQPVLEGRGQFSPGIIQVYSSGSADAPAAAAALQAKVAATPGVLHDSVKQENFAADGGMRGIRVSYAFTSVKMGQTIQICSHLYFFQNKIGRLVSIKYVTTADRDSDIVDQMIRKTLILQ